jgi:hypothetical protein
MIIQITNRSFFTSEKKPSLDSVTKRPSILRVFLTDSRQPSVQTEASAYLIRGNEAG